MNFSGLVRQYKVTIIIFLGLLIGTVYANVSVKVYNAEPEAFSSTFLAAYEEVEVNSFYLWQYVFKTRLRDFLLLAVMSFTNLGKVATNAYLVYFGTTAGAMLSFAVMHYGATGIWVYLLSVLPQYILYIIAYWIIYKIVTGERARVREKVLMMVLMLILVFAGTYVESYVNPLVMQWLYSVWWF